MSEEAQTIEDLASSIARINEAVSFLARSNIEVKLDLTSQQQFGIGFDRQILSATVRKIMRKL